MRAQTWTMEYKLEHFVRKNRNNRVEVTKLIKMRHRTGDHIRVTN